MSHKIPRLTDEMRAFIVENLAAGKPLRQVANALIQRHPELFSEIEGCHLEEVKEILYKRLRNHKYDPRYSSYWEIKEAQEEIISEIEEIDIADPIQQLRMLDQMYKQMDAAETREEIDKLAKKIQTRLKIMADATKIVKMILPSDDGKLFDTDLNDIPPPKT